MSEMSDNATFDYSEAFPAFRQLATDEAGNKVAELICDARTIEDHERDDPFADIRARYNPDGGIRVWGAIEFIPDFRMPFDVPGEIIEAANIAAPYVALDPNASEADIRELIRGVKH